MSQQNLDLNPEQFGLKQQLVTLQEQNFELRQENIALRQEILRLHKQIAKLKVKVISKDAELQIANDLLIKHDLMRNSAAEELEAFIEFLQKRQPDNEKK